VCVCVSVCVCVWVWACVCVCVCVETKCEGERVRARARKEKKKWIDASVNQRILRYRCKGKLCVWTQEEDASERGDTKGKRVQERSRAPTRESSPSHTHTYTHTHTHTHTHTLTSTHTNAHTHTNTRARARAHPWEVARENLNRHGPKTFQHWWHDNSFVGSERYNTLWGLRFSLLHICCMIEDAGEKNKDRCILGTTAIQLQKRSMGSGSFAERDW